MHGNQVSAADRRLTGIVQGLTFHNAQTGFFVARVRVAGIRDEQTVVGAAASITTGEQLEAKGRWVSSNYGPQFKADEIRLTLPVDAAGLVKFLANALPGIGTTYATKLVAAFGTDVPRIIEKEPWRLFDVPGIGKKRGQAIIDLWTERGQNHDILSWLCGLGLSPALAGKLHQVYGTATRETISRDPYQLAEVLNGIGFLKADAIAAKIGIAPSNPFRIRAAIRHLMRQAGEMGSCGLPRENVRFDALGLLNFGPHGLELIDRELTALLETNTLVAAEVSGIDCLFLSGIFRQEEDVALDLVERLRAPVLRPIGDTEPAVLAAEEAIGITLETSQRRAVATALQETLTVITGGPGTGKTTITRVIVEAFQDAGLNVFVCAPTGKAAKRASEAIGIPARTIHRTLEIRDNRFVHDRQNPLECDVLIVDEMSMVDIPLFRSLISAVAPGTRVVLIGDEDQLPSVGPGKVLADIIASRVIPTVRLTEVFRQARESRIIMNAHRVNAGETPELTPPAKRDFGFYNLPDDRMAQAALLKTAAELWWPGKYLPGKSYDPIRDVQVLTPMRKGVLGVDELNRELRRRLNPTPAAEIPFRDGHLGTGDKVIQTRNNYHKEVFNGEIGYVVAADPGTRRISVDFDGRLLDYTSGELDDLRLAYALTIHRSQGSEFPVVLLAISNSHFVMLKRNLLYTGITRARDLLLLFGNPRAVTKAVGDSQVAERYSKLKDWLVRDAAAR